MSTASIAHVSIPAREPLHVARLLAPLIDGEVFDFPVVPGACIVVARDGSGLALEVVPDGTRHAPGRGERDPALETGEPVTQPWEVQISTDGDAAQLGPTHMALATPLDTDAILAIGRNAGWRAVPCERAGVFGVVELWVENRFMLELLPAGEAARYRAFMRPEVCGDMFGPPLTEASVAA